MVAIKDLKMKSQSKKSKKFGSFSEGAKTKKFSEAAKLRLRLQATKKLFLKF